MIGCLGVPGAMVALPYRGGLSTKTDRPAKSTRTLGGKVKFLIGPRARREWSVSFDLTGSRETAGLVEIARSGGGVLWYPADATSGNLLSPQAAGFEVAPANSSLSGLVQLPDGTVAVSVAQAGSSPVGVGAAHGTWEWVPVRSGVPATVAAWGRGGLRLTGAWRDAAGASVGTFAPAGETFAGWGWRSYTATPPAGAVYVTLNLSGGSQYARPSISWGAVAHNKPGRGCPKALVHGLSESLSVIARDDAYGSVDVTISEVG